MPAEGVSTSPSGEATAEAGNRAPSGEPREKRSRGRERGPRAERGDRPERQDRPEVQGREASVSDGSPSEEPRKSYFAAPAAAPVTAPVVAASAVPEQAATVTAPVVALVPEPVTPAPVAVAPVVAAAAEPSPVVAAVAAPAAPARVVQPAATAVATSKVMPAVQPFALPLGELAAVAETSGLSWVNTDPAKVAAVQAAIAAEPKPVHVPRVRPPVPVLDEGPLVLVETRRDLRDLKLPFETTQPGA